MAPAAAVDIEDLATPCSYLMDLRYLVSTYITTAIPFDPADGASADTKYTIQIDAVGTPFAPSMAQK